MQIISELEQMPREAYTGSVGYLKGVDKHLPSSDSKSSVIKKKYTDKTSAIYDKIDKK